MQIWHRQNRIHHFDDSLGNILVVCFLQGRRAVVGDNSAMFRRQMRTVLEFLELLRRKRVEAQLSHCRTQVESRQPISGILQCGLLKAVPRLRP